MKFDVDNGDRGVGISRETGEPIKFLLRGDDEEGWYDQFVHDAEGTIVHNPKTHAPIVRRRKGRFVFIRDGNKDE
jgi:hypothetical protein